MYPHEMSRERHRELAGLLRSFPGMVALSGYRCPDYDEWFGDWERHDREVRCSMSWVGGTGSTKGLPRPRRVESLWLNPAAARARGKVRQLSLFPGPEA